MKQQLDNIMWNCLSGPHEKFSSGTAGIRRYAPGFSPIVGFADVVNPDFAALSACCEPGEHFYCEIWNGAAPPGWQIEAEARMVKMVWEAPMPDHDAAPDAIALTAAHVDQALELALLTKPGPFGLRTIELGDYFGFFEGERLMAMAGERMQAGRYHEISGVCTHPDFQGRGLARKLMLKLLRLQMLHNEIPFLHVMCDNVVARQMYERMGFRVYRESLVRVIGRA